MSEDKQARFLALVNDLIAAARESGVIHLHTEDDYLSGRTVEVGGNNLVNFASCSYLGLELDARLKEGACDAVMRYGTQFSASRAYISLGLYQEAEELFSQIFGSPALITGSTTLGHHAFLPAMIGSRDAVLMDHQVHASLQSASQSLRARGVPVEILRHNQMEPLEEALRRLEGQHERVWYFADGLYSMYGDFAPAAELLSLLEGHEKLHLYIDDAHGVSWMGERGCGFARTHFGLHPRIFLAASLSKSFGAGGGLLVFPDEASRDWVRACGGTLIFAGPLQPPTLGALLASARIHLSHELALRQQKLAGHIALFNRLLEQKNLPQPEKTGSPIFYLRVGAPERAVALSRRLMERGYLTNLAIFPSVPYQSAGIRVILNHHLLSADLIGLSLALHEELPLLKIDIQEYANA